MGVNIDLISIRKRYLTLITSSTLPVSQWYPSLSLEELWNIINRINQDVGLQLIPNTRSNGNNTLHGSKEAYIIKRKPTRINNSTLPATPITTKIIAGEWLEIRSFISIVISIKSSECPRPWAFHAQISTALTFNLSALFINYDRLQPYKKKTVKLTW